MQCLSSPNLQPQGLWLASEIMNLGQHLEQCGVCGTDSETRPLTGPGPLLPRLGNGDPSM